MRGICLSACLATMLIASTAAIASPKLHALLQSMQSLRGEFSQQMHAVDSGQILETSSGNFSLLQPGNLRWHILEPDEQQLVTADGYLWHYDVELETATRRGFDADSPRSPLAILAGNSQTLEQHYRVLEADAEPGEQAWLLEPLFARAEFQQLLIVFRKGKPVRMQVLDLLDRTTVIAFSALELNPELERGLFDFTPPPGTDVYEHE